MRKAAIVLVATCSLAAPLGAQTPSAARPAAPAPAVEAQAAQGQVLVLQDDSAGETRGRLQELLRQYPPSLSTVLRLDPSLLTTASYISPYPALAAFLGQHPEIARNPTFFSDRPHTATTATSRRSVSARAPPKA